MPSIYLIKQGSFSGTNGRIVDALSIHFPGDELRVIDVRADWINCSPVVRFMGWVWAAAEFFPLIYRRQRTLGELYLRSSRMGAT